jgi:hypothetical protein
MVEPSQAQRAAIAIQMPTTAQEEFLQLNERTTDMPDGSLSASGCERIPIVKIGNTVSLIGFMLTCPNMDKLKPCVLENAFLRNLLLRCCCSFVFGNCEQVGAILSVMQQSPGYWISSAKLRVESALASVLGASFTTLVPAIAQTLMYLTPRHTAILPNVRALLTLNQALLLLPSRSVA